MGRFSFVSYLKKVEWSKDIFTYMLGGYLLGVLVNVFEGKANLNHVILTLGAFVTAGLIVHRVKYTSWLKEQLLRRITV